MTQDQDVFCRYEKNYLLDEAQYRAVRKAMAGRMARDRYGRDAICNLYYDTGTFELIRRSLEKPLYKEKLRLRSYGIPNPDDLVFLELKKKFDGVVYKRRTELSYREAQRYLLTGGTPGETDQIFREIDWFRRSMPLRPAVFIACDRTAYFDDGGGDLRITFDDNLRFRRSSLSLSKGDWGTPLMNPGEILMEVKIPGAMPLWLGRTLSEAGAFPSSFSKYGVCYQKYLSRREGGSACA